jgi:sulfonate transport system substrate-binding protein
MPYVDRRHMAWRTDDAAHVLSRRGALAALGAASAASIAVLLHGRWRSKLAQKTAVRIAYVGMGQTGPSGTSGLVVSDGWLERALGDRAAGLEWVAMPNANVGPMTNEAFANGSIDLAGYGELPSIIANAAGIHTKLIVPAGRGGDTYLLVPPDSSAQSIGDLRGKRVAIHRGRPWELPLSRLIDSAGLRYDDFVILNLNPEAGAAALAAHKIDALCLPSTAYILEDKGVGKIIWSTEGAPADWKMLGGLWAAAEFIEHHADLTQLVATAYVRANYWASKEENREAMIKLATQNGTPESVVRREYQSGSWRDRWSPLFDDAMLSHYDHAIAYAFEKHIIDHRFAFRDCYSDAFVSTAVGELGLSDYWQRTTGG